LEVIGQVDSPENFCWLFLSPRHRLRGISGTYVCSPHIKTLLCFYWLCSLGFGVWVRVRFGYMYFMVMFAYWRP